jgi:predicted nucleic acid-binding protein
MLSVLVVSDASPLRALAHLELLHVLPALYDVIVIPPAVLRELEASSSRFGALSRRELRSARIAAPADEGKVRELEAQLDRGEAEAIALAIETKANALLIDEAKGRKVARRLGLGVIGTLAVLRDAKATGQVARVRPLVDRLMSEIDFYLDRVLVDEYLSQLGE